MSTSKNGDEPATEIKETVPIQRIALGTVMPIGGAEEKHADGGILERFVEIAGGKRARILLIPSASTEPEDAARRYTEVLTKHGARAVDVLEVDERPDANSEKNLKLLETATGVFISGGDQARLVSLLSGTIAMEHIRLRNLDGVIVAGTSAGASILATHMLVGGTSFMPEGSGDASARKAMVELVAGFGLVRDTIIDQHFSQRGRMGRLLSAFAANPGLLGIGLDEDTAALIDENGILEVLGSGMVTIVDGRNATSDYFEREPGEVLSVVDSHLFVLGPGRRMDIIARQPIPFDETEYTGPRSEEILAAAVAKRSPE